MTRARTGLRPCAERRAGSCATFDSSAAAETWCICRNAGENATRCQRYWPRGGAHRIDVPVRPPQQALHPVRRNISGLLSQGPAVAPVQARDSPVRYCQARRRGSERANALQPTMTAMPAGRR